MPLSPSNSRAASLCLALGILWGAAPRSGLADANDAAPSAKVGGVVEPPRLLDRVEADYPQAALRAGQAGSVLLAITIDASGSVTEAEVTEPAGHGFDEAAQRAVLQFRFEPARRGGTPLTARILYRYDFVPAPEAPPQPVAHEATPETLDEPVLEVTARGESEADALRNSVRAVQVIETREVKQQALDTGEVLARSEGLALQREGGLGSRSKLSIHGLSGERIRVFLDGLPTEAAGYPADLSTLPVNLTSRIEVYRGVVPARLGADALGGAVNLVTTQPETSSAMASYQVGSFGTQRLAAHGTSAHRGGRLWLRAFGFLDRAENDYRITLRGTAVPSRPDGSVPDEPQKVYRFHDAYRSLGAHVEAGIREQRWARELVLRGFVVDLDKELQHSPFMIAPAYGEVLFRKRSAGANARHALRFGQRFELRTQVAFARNYVRLRDLGTCNYNWYGQCLSQTPPGEIGVSAQALHLYDHTVLTRSELSVELAAGHALRLSFTPTYLRRSATDFARPEGEQDQAARTLYNQMAGVELENQSRDERFVHLAFFKSYFSTVRTRDDIAGNRFLQDVDERRTPVGLGDSLRFEVAPGLMLKASYEWATRFPSANEIFGDGAFIEANVLLNPESSHNLNLSARLTRESPRLGSVTASLTGFARLSRDLVVLAVQGQYAKHENVRDTRALGFETAASFQSPRDYVRVQGNLTYQDNRAARGGPYTGQRVPNVPFLLANGEARLNWQKPMRSEDMLSLLWHTRYVHPFFRTWEGDGKAATKASIPAQTLHGLSLLYEIRTGGRSLSTALEVQNITDAEAYDYFGLQRPGRSFFAKLTLET